MDYKNMRKLFVAIIMLTALAVNAQDVVSLAGMWKFTTVEGKAEAGSSLFTLRSSLKDQIKLPGSMLTNGKGDLVNVQTKWTGSLYDSSFYFNPYMEKYRHEGQMKFPFFLTPDRHYVGNALYERTVTVPQSWRGRQVTLFLERPHIETTVRVNGHEVGHEMSLSVPHQYDVTPYIRFGKKNTITILVYNGIENVCVGQDSHSVTDQTQGNWNGLAGRMELQASPMIWRLRVVPHIENATADVIVNDTTYRIEIPRPVRLWSESDPYLYTREVEYRGQRIPVTFGMREVCIRDGQIQLNGKPIRLRGTVENCCFPETGYPPTDIGSWMRLLGKCKEYGLNHVRFHSYCPPEAAFTAADRLGIYLQPEGPSWPNHGVKLGYGMAIDTYLKDECRRIIDQYGSHPSFMMMAAGNEPAGRWVEWGRKFVSDMKTYDPSRIYCTASVGGGWQWDDGSEYHVKGGARGLDWNRHAPQTTDDFSQGIAFPRNYRDTVANSSPIIAHEVGQWCVFPDFTEVSQYNGAYKAGNIDIFRDLLARGGMASQAEKFLMASGHLQVLCYKYDMERNMRTPGYAGFQLLGLNDYSGQGSAFVGPLNVHWREKGYVSAREWTEFCAPVVPMARLERFVFTEEDTINVGVSLYNTTGQDINAVGYYITAADGQMLAAGNCQVDSTFSFVPSAIENASKLTLTLDAAGHKNHYELWVYPHISDEMADSGDIYITDSLDDKVVSVLQQGGKVLITAAGKVTYGNDIKHTFLPVFWNTSWFKMRPPHTTGAYIEKNHPVFRDFPTDDWQNLNWWELVNRTQVMNLAEFPADYQPPVQPIDTWHVSRKLAMMIEVRVGAGRLLMTTLPIGNPKGIVARQLRRSVINYMQSDAFRPSITVDAEVISHLFTRQAPPVNMFTNDSPDELKPVIK